MIKNVVHLLNGQQLPLVSFVPLLTASRASSLFFFGLVTCGPSVEGGLEELVELLDKEGIFFSGAT